MKNYMKILILIMGILVLTSCKKTDLNDPAIGTDLDGETKPIAPIVSLEEDDEDEEEIELPTENIDLSTEEGIRDYLIGDWICNIEYMSNIFAYMNIDENFDLEILFQDTYENEEKGLYKGKLVLDRLYAGSDEAPDIIRIELEDDKYSYADFFFLHRTIYEGNQVMSLFFTGDGNSVFSKLLGYEGEYADDEFNYMIDQLFFHKPNNQLASQEKRINDTFNAVFWGHAYLYESVWLDDVIWTPSPDDDFEAPYPMSMTNYENETRESIVYNIAEDKVFEILGDNMFQGEVYYVETDENGDIIEIIDAEYKVYLEDNPEGFIDEYPDYYEYSEIEDQIFDIIYNDIVEIREYIDGGMTVLYTRETTMIYGEEYYNIFLGTDYDDIFVREIHYGVNPISRAVYKYNVIDDIWEEMGAG